MITGPSPEEEQFLFLFFPPPPSPLFNLGLKQRLLSFLSKRNKKEKIPSLFSLPPPPAEEKWVPLRFFFLQKRNVTGKLSLPFFRPPREITNFY